VHDFNVNKRLWDQTDELGEANRRRLEEARIYCVNVMSAPGAGKTTLLERTLERLAPGPRFAVIEGDIQGRADADRLERFGIPVRQINTNGACHLDPRQVAAALDTMDLGSIDLLVIENVGNLVCPAEFDLGEADRVMLLSVTEGHDKPAKYPLMFRTADLLILNKIDLLPHTDFDLAEASRMARVLREGIEIMEVSCRTGEGLDRWIAWLEHRLAHARGHWDGMPHAHPHGQSRSHDPGHSRAGGGPAGA
jgi:hydrogenase nickel incorporation protein HypB